MKAGQRQRPSGRCIARFPSGSQQRCLSNNLETPAPASPASRAARRGWPGPAPRSAAPRCLLATSFLARASTARPLSVRTRMCERRSLVGAHPRAKVAALQRVEHRDEIRPEDAERVGDLGLVAAGILVEQQQHRELRRRQLQRRDAAQEVLEHLELRPLRANSRAIRTVRPVAACCRPRQDRPVPCAGRAAIGRHRSAVLETVIARGSQSRYKNLAGRRGPRDYI